MIDAIETDLEWVREHTDWGQKALEWEHHDRDRSFLLSGSELEAAEGWLARQSGKVPSPTKVQNEYVLESRRAAVGRLRRTRALVTAGMAIAIVLSIVALVQRSSAIANEHTAESRQLAASAESVLPTDPELSTLLSLKALSITYTTQAEAALRDALPDLQSLKTLQTGSIVRGTAFSADGRLIVTAGDDGTARTWHAATGKPTGVTIKEPSGAGFQAATFLPVGSLVVMTSSSDGTVRLWSATTGREIGGSFRDPGGYSINDAEFNADGSRFVVADAGGNAYVLGGPTAITIKEPGGNGFTKATFSPNGRLIATASLDGTARIWNAATGKPTGVTLGALGHVPITDVSFSPDGKLLATADDLGLANVWSASSGDPTNLGLDEPRGGSFTSIRFSHDGRLILTTSDDGTARVWDARSGLQLTLLAGHSGPVFTASFSPGDDEVVTGSADGTARVWDSLPRELLRTIPEPGGGMVTGSAFSPDGSMIATASGDGTARVSDASSGRSAGFTIRAPGGGPLDGMAFSPDGRFIVTAGSDGAARVWKAATGQPTGISVREPARAALHAASLPQWSADCDGRR